MKNILIIVFVCLIATFTSLAQVFPKSYVAAKVGICTPIIKFASTEGVNTSALLFAFANPLNNNSNASMLIPPVASPSYSVEGTCYFYKNFGINMSGSYTDMKTDGSAIENNLNYVINQGITQLLPLINQNANTQGLLNNATFKANLKSTNWQLYTILLGPSVGFCSGKFTFDVYAKAGLINITTPEVISTLDYNVPLVFGGFNVGNLNGTILKFSQAAISKNIFAYQFGYSIRYKLHEFLSIKLYTSFDGSANANYDLKVNTSVPSLNEIENLGGPLNLTLPTEQKTIYQSPTTTINVGIGICFEFGNTKVAKVDGETDNELEKQR